MYYLKLLFDEYLSRTAIGYINEQLKMLLLLLNTPSEWGSFIFKRAIDKTRCLFATRNNNLFQRCKMRMVTWKIQRQLIVV